jgi:hypothetical protein
LNLRKIFPWSALGVAMLKKAQANGISQRLRFA